MNQELKYEGRVYFKRNGKWYDKQNYIEASINLQNRLNSFYNNNINFENMDYFDIIKIADGYKKSESFILAIKAYKKAMEKTKEIKEIKYILPRIVSCYRKNNQSRDAIEEYIDMYESYGYSILDPVLLTSVAAAYIDVGQYEKAKKCANQSYAMLDGKCSDELYFVYQRLNKYL